MRAIDLSATLTSFETWQNTLGLGVMSESNHGTRTGIYVMTQLPIITNALFFSMRVERNVFAASSNALAAAAAVGPDGVPANPLLAGDYSEWLVRASISCRW